MRESTSLFFPRQPIPPDPTDGFAEAIVTARMGGSSACEVFPPVQWDKVVRLARIMQTGRLILRPVRPSIPDHLALAGSFLVAG